MDEDNEKIPRQEKLEFKQTADKPRELKLIEEAQDQGILSLSVQLPLPEGVNAMTGLRGFFFGKRSFGLRIEGAWMDRHSVSLLPIGLQTFHEASQPATKQEWNLLFIPLFINTTAIIIPDFGNGPSVKGINVALPIKEWPAEKLDEVSDLLVNSRKTLIHPNVSSTSKNHPYSEIRDIWNIYLKIKDNKLPEKTKRALESTTSTNQIKYSKQFQGI